MGCRILYDSQSDLACLYCSTTDVAFGPVFYKSDEQDADERAEAFIAWLKTDPRKLTDAELSAAYGKWTVSEMAPSAERESQP